MDASKRAATVGALASGGRILVTRLQYLGDVVLTLPLISTLKEAFPSIEIDYLSKKDGASLLDGDPLLSRVFALPAGRGSTFRTLRLIRELRSRRYSVAIDLLSNPRSAGLTFLSGASMRIGGERRVRRRLYTDRISVPPGVRAATIFHQHFLAPLGLDPVARKPELSLSREERLRARAQLEASGVKDGDLTIGLHPGGKWDVKRWPIDYFARLAHMLADEMDARIVVIHGPGEEALKNTLETSLGVKAVYLPLLPVRETAAIINLLDGMVVCDGGIMHVSVAVGTPTVGIFGSSEPDVWFPYSTFGPFRPAFHPIECRPCHSHTCDHLDCLMKLSPESVKDAMEMVLAGRMKREPATDGQ